MNEKSKSKNEIKIFKITGKITSHFDLKTKNTTENIYKIFMSERKNV